MIPRILEYEDGRIRVTPEAYSIPEIKAILDKYDMKADPYLVYVHLMSSVDSPYINIPEDEKEEIVTYDVIQTIGDLDTEDPLIEPAIKRLKRFYESPMMLLSLELAEELHRFRKLLSNTPLTMGAEGNFKDRLSLMKDIEKVATNYTRVKETADKELQTKMRGKSVLGDY